MKRQFARRYGRRRGTVIIMIAVLLLVAASIVAAVVQLVLADARQFANDRLAIQAERLAEAGLARGAARHARDVAYAGENWNIELVEGEAGEVVIALSESEGVTTLLAKAVFPAGTSRAARATRSTTLAQAVENEPATP